MPQGFRVVSKGGPFIAPAATLTSNCLWTPAVLEQASVGDAQHGGIIGALDGTLDLDLAPNFHEVGWRKVEQIDGPHRVAEQEGEKWQTPSQQPAARLATRDFVVCAEVNRGVEIDRTTEIFCCMQSGRQIGDFDKAVMDGQMPEAFKDADQI
jgi:hypothetical protein